MPGDRDDLFPLCAFGIVGAEYPIPYLCESEAGAFTAAELFIGAGEYLQLGDRLQACFLNPSTVERFFEFRLLVWVRDLSQCFRGYTEDIGRHRPE